VAFEGFGYAPSTGLREGLALMVEAERSARPASAGLLDPAGARP
jgi:hypothetical protein